MKSLWRIVFMPLTLIVAVWICVFVLAGTAGRLVAARIVRRAAAPLPVPADLAAALKKNKAAAAGFDAMSPGHRKDYIEDHGSEAGRDQAEASRDPRRVDCRGKVPQLEVRELLKPLSTVCSQLPARSLRAA